MTRTSGTGGDRAGRLLASQAPLRSSSRGISSGSLTKLGSRAPSRFVPQFQHTSKVFGTGLRHCGHGQDRSVESGRGSSMSGGGFQVLSGSSVGGSSTSGLSSMSGGDSDFIPAGMLPSATASRNEPQVRQIRAGSSYCREHFGHFHIYRLPPIPIPMRYSASQC